MIQLLYYTYIMQYQDIPHYWINHLSFQLRKELEKRFLARGYKVTSEEWALLLITHSHGQLSPSELAHKTLRDVTTVSRLIDRLERKGLIARTRTRQDRRIVDISLTATGEETFARLMPITSELIADSLRDIPPSDIEQLVQTLQKISANLKDR